MQPHLFDFIRRTSEQMNSQQVIYGAQTMDSMISDSLAARRFSMILLGAGGRLTADRPFWNSSSHL